VVLTHETDQSCAWKSAEGRLAVGAVDQLVPFHSSARVVELVHPTAMQKEALTQETASRAFPPTVGELTIDQLDPFHCSVRVPPVVLDMPTPAQKLAVTQLVPFSWLELALAVEGAGTSLQLVALTVGGEL
jgi:hypothetical protein